MNDLALVVKAAAFAALKHRDQRRKSGDVPYVNHPLSVARSLSEEGGVTDAKTLAAALLHDTVEDTGTTRAELEREFGADVAAAVAEVTDDKSLPKDERKRAQIAHAPHLSERARLVKLADKLDNLRNLLADPPPSWSLERIQGYFCWAERVVRALGDANAGLCRALHDVFGREITRDGRHLPAVPADAAERDAVLARYYESMRRNDD